MKLTKKGTKCPKLNKKLLPKGKSTRNTIRYWSVYILWGYTLSTSSPFFVCTFRVRCVLLHQSYYDSIHPLCLCIHKNSSKLLFYDFCLNHLPFSSLFSIVTEYVSYIVYSAQNITRNIYIFIYIRSFKAHIAFFCCCYSKKNDDFALDNAKKWKKLGSQFICRYKKK